MAIGSVAGKLELGVDELGVEIEWDCRDLGPAVASIGLSLSYDREVSSVGENGDTGLETGLRLPLL